ncbi:MAG: tyrosine decarboxylase [Armatimonadetes bacterium]|nr:tyrosine decarboxylase [Armatimonadota bacterium]
MGPKSENRRFFKEMLEFVMDEHIHWRRDFHPSDRPIAGPAEQRSEAYQDALVRTEEALLELSARLKGSSVPAFSPRYLAHMLSDTLMAANLGYLATILYNPNNCSYEASSAATRMEIEVGRQLAELFGYEPSRAWGHITAGGTIANYEALWVARNLKSLPFAVREIHPEMVHGLSGWELANLPPQRALDLLQEVKLRGSLQEVRRMSVQHRGLAGGPELGRVLVPQSRHYSWAKAVDILGLGADRLVEVPVNERFRMDVRALERIIGDLAADSIPILAVVAVLGTTEAGAVDEVHRIVELRRELQRRGMSFYLHLDAAYGGYARAILRDEDGSVLPLERLTQVLARHGCLDPRAGWPDPDVYAAYSATGEADSITVDPHKLGYVPYAAGGVVMKDRRILDLISYFAAYVFEEGDIRAEDLGSFIMEGSKPGASAASVWMAHRVLPLDVTGYGKLIGNSIEGAQKLYLALRATPMLELDGQRYRLAALMRPDLNLVNYAFNAEGNTSLETMEALNRAVYERCSYRSGPVYLEDFITSKTILDRSVYGDAPRAFVERLGIPAAEWDRAGRVFVMRSCVMTPFLASHQSFEACWFTFLETMKRHLAEIGMRARSGGLSGAPLG